MVMGTMSVTPNQAAMASGAGQRLREERQAAEQRVRDAQGALQAELLALDQQYHAAQQDATRERADLDRQVNAARQALAFAEASVRNPYAAGQAGIATYGEGGAVPHYADGNAPAIGAVRKNNVRFGRDTYDVWNGVQWVPFGANQAAAEREGAWLRTEAEAEQRRQATISAQVSDPRDAPRYAGPPPAPSAMALPSAPSPAVAPAPSAPAWDVPLSPVMTRPAPAAAVAAPMPASAPEPEPLPPAPAGPSMLPARSVPADPDVAAGAADARADFERAQAVRGQMRPPGQPSMGMAVPPSVSAATNTVRFPDVLPPAPSPPPEPRFGRTAAGNARVAPGQSDAWNDWYAQTGQAPPFAPASATNPALRFAEGGAFGLPPAPSDALRSDEMDSAMEPNAITGEEPMGDDYRAELVIGPPGSGDRAVYHTEGPRASNLDEGTIIVPVAGAGEDEARMFPLAPGMAATKQGNRYKAGGKLYGKGGKVKRMAEGGAYGLPPAPRFKSPWSTRNTAPVPGLHPPGFTGETPRATGPGSYPLPGTGVLGMAPWAGYQLPPAPINMQQWLQWDDEQRQLYDQQLKSMGYMQGVAGMQKYLELNAPGTVGGGVYAG